MAGCVCRRIMVIGRESGINEPRSNSSQLCFSHFMKRHESIFFHCLELGNNQCRKNQCKKTLNLNFLQRVMLRHIILGTLWQWKNLKVFWRFCSTLCTICLLSVLPKMWLVLHRPSPLQSNHLKLSVCAVLQFSVCTRNHQN